MYLTNEQRKKLMRALANGLFVSCGKEHPNIMTTHWGALGTFWHKQVFVLPVRTDKYSYEVVKKSRSFAVSVPTTDMRNEIVLCEHMSGYNVNKFDALHLHPQRAKKIPAYVLSECGLILECKVLFTAAADDSCIDETLRADMYDGKEYHSMFFGEVVECYENR